MTCHDLGQGVIGCSRGKKPPKPGVRALSWRQPWAWAVLHAGKDVDNRPKSCWYRGPLLLHASSSMTKAEYMEFLQFYGRLLLKPLAIPGPDAPGREEFVRGAIVGAVELVDCVREHPSPWFTGPYGYVVANPVAFPEPVRVTGMLGLWIPTPATVAACRVQYRAAKVAATERSAYER